LKPFLAVWFGLGISLTHFNWFGFWFGRKGQKPNQTKLPQHYYGGDDARGSGGSGVCGGVVARICFLEQIYVFELNI
jgi:hypothetical protein